MKKTTMKIESEVFQEFIKTKWKMEKDFNRNVENSECLKILIESYGGKP